MTPSSRNVSSGSMADSMWFTTAGSASVGASEDWHSAHIISNFHLGEPADDPRWCALAAATAPLASGRELGHPGPASEKPVDLLAGATRASQASNTGHRTSAGLP